MSSSTFRDFFSLGAGVTPAEGSVKPTAGFTFYKVISPSPSRIDYHQRALGEYSRQLFDVTVVDRDASRGPVDVASIELWLVATVDSDSAADAHRMAVLSGHFAVAAHLLVAMAVDLVGIVQREEPI